MRFNLANEIFSKRSREKLLHIPRVLKTPSVELEENKIRGPDHQGAADRLGPLEDFRLPGELSDYNIDRTLAGSPEPHHPRQGIGQVTFPDLDGNTAVSQVCPEIGSQAGCIGGE